MPADPAGVVVRALYGPPRPVLVVTVTGEVDRRNDQALFDRLREETASGDHRQRFGCRTVSAAMVLDLRSVTFFSATSLASLAQQHDLVTRPLRLVLGPGEGAVRRSLAHLALTDTFECFDEIVDAVLAEVVPG